MKKLLLSLFFLLLAAAGGYYAGMQMKKPAALAVNEHIFVPTAYPLVNRSFVVAIVGYNNGATVEKTLRSIFSQNYADFRIVYIDDGSEDGSQELARDLIFDSGHLSHTNFIQNERRLGTLANLATVVQSCREEEIMVVVGGDDWLAHEWVLMRLNQYYADPSLWMTYGQYREYPQYTLGFSHAPDPSKPERQQPFFASHLKTFYAGLFKQIRESDLMEGNSYLLSAGDLAIMFPMLEMAKGHSAFLSEILYIENQAVPSKEDREEMLRCERIVRSLESYESLVTLGLSL